jgi:hypothetical protein
MEGRLMEKEHWEYLSQVMSYKLKLIKEDLDLPDSQDPNKTIYLPVREKELKMVNVILKYIDNNLDAGGAL